MLREPLLSVTTYPEFVAEFINSYLFSNLSKLSVCLRISSDVLYANDHLVNFSLQVSNILNIKKSEDLGRVLQCGLVQFETRSDVHHRKRFATNNFGIWILQAVGVQSSFHQFTAGF